MHKVYTVNEVQINDWFTINLNYFAKLIHIALENYSSCLGRYSLILLIETLFGLGGNYSFIAQTCDKQSN